MQTARGRPIHVKKSNYLFTLKEVIAFSRNLVDHSRSYSNRHSCAVDPSKLCFMKCSEILLRQLLPLKRVTPGKDFDAPDRFVTTESLPQTVIYSPPKIRTIPYSLDVKPVRRKIRRTFIVADQKKQEEVKKHRRFAEIGTACCPCCPPCFCLIFTLLLALLLLAGLITLLVLLLTNHSTTTSSTGVVTYITW